MARDFLERRLHDIVGFPIELVEYQRWLSEQKPRAPAQRDYLFAEPKPRFEPRREDVVATLPGLSLVRRGGKSMLAVERPRVELVLEGVKHRDAERIVGAIDGQRCLLEVGWEAGVEAPVLARFLRATFGRVVFAPEAVEQLERRLSGADICRFASPPYAIERAYWENMIAVRDHFALRRDTLEQLETWVTSMRELHVLALMGRNLQSFYKPASPVADQRVAPGTLYLDEPRLLESARGTIFLDGPRVKVPLLGGARYHAVLCDQLGDPDATAPRREHLVEGLSWGRVVTARGERDEAAAPWFCPPRPMSPAHFDALRAALASALTAAEGGDGDGAVAWLARFHQAWVRLHPFHCANQSIAMNLVGAVLLKSHGAGMPDGILDHFALRLAPEAYERLFRRAVAAHVVVEEHPARRLAALDAVRQRWFAMVERIESCESDEQVRALIDQHHEDALAALLIDSRAGD